MAAAMLTLTDEDFRQLNEAGQEEWERQLQGQTTG
jgi:hypothetical protein